MPIIFTAFRICENFGKKFEWNCFKLNRQRSDSQSLTIERPPFEKTLAHSCEQRDDNAYDVEVNCPHCGYDNHFSHILEQE